MAKAIIILLGFAVGALSITAVVMTEAAGSARDDARQAAAKVATSDGRLAWPAWTWAARPAAPERSPS